MRESALLVILSSSVIFTELLIRYSKDIVYGVGTTPSGNIYASCVQVFRHKIYIQPRKNKQIDNLRLIWCVQLKKILFLDVLVYIIYKVIHQKPVSFLFSLCSCFNDWYSKYKSKIR